METIHDDVLSGHASEYFLVKVKGCASDINQMKDVYITHYENGSIYGTIV